MSLDTIQAMSDEWEHIDLGTMICGGCNESTGAWLDRRKDSTAETVSINCKCGHVNQWPVPQR